MSRPAVLQKTRINFFSVLRHAGQTPPPRILVKLLDVIGPLKKRAALGGGGVDLPELMPQTAAGGVLAVRLA